MRLVRRHQLIGLVTAVQEFNVTVINDILSEIGGKPALLLTDIEQHGLGVLRNRLASPLAAFVLALAGIEPDDATRPTPPPEPSLTPADFHTKLFETATGWLGWSPEQAWASTPDEIMAAKSGRTDLITDVLKAVFGTSDKRQTSSTTYTVDQLKQVDDLGHDPAFDRNAFDQLKAGL
jgi:hypothetical protein